MTDRYGDNTEHRHPIPDDAGRVQDSRLSQYGSLQPYPDDGGRFKQTGRRPESGLKSLIHATPAAQRAVQGSRRVDRGAPQVVVAACSLQQMMQDAGGDPA